MTLSQQLQKDIKRPYNDIEKIKKANELSSGDKKMSQFFIKRLKSKTKKVEK